MPAKDVTTWVRVEGKPIEDRKGIYFREDLGSLELHTRERNPMKRDRRVRKGKEGREMMGVTIPQTASGQGAGEEPREGKGDMGDMPGLSIL